MELKKGYKNTELGVIPEDWEIKKLGEIAEIYQPQTISQNVFINDGYLVYGANGVVGKYHLYNHETWQTTITCRGSTCGTVNRTIGKSWITGNAMVMNVDKSSNINKLFFYYILTKQDFSQCITGSGQPQIVRSPLFEFKLSAPKSKDEQEVIANKLSDMDALISSLEKLIAKKRSIKLGAMQKLLQPKDDWEIKKLGEIAEIYQPQTISQNVFINDGYLVYGANGVVGKYHLYNHETWQTTITCRGSTCGTVNRTIGKSWITGNAMVMNVDKSSNINKLFFYYILTKQDFSQCITGSGQPQIVRSPLFEFKLSAPKSKDEQEVIANKLSDMDAEIAALETKLDKYRKIKLGMMQNLLTGRIRLI
jgi:type I restriction enzyme S subunit